MNKDKNYLQVHKHLQPILCIIGAIIILILLCLAMCPVYKSGLIQIEVLASFVILVFSLYLALTLYLLASVLSIMAVCWFSSNTEEAEQKFLKRYLIVSSVLSLLFAVTVRILPLPVVITEDLDILLQGSATELVVHFAIIMLVMCSVGILIGSIPSIKELIVDISKRKKAKSLADDKQKE